MGFQYPVEIPGVNNAEFLRMAYNARLLNEGKDEVDPLDFDDILQEKMDMLGMEDKYKERSCNDGFSGGEKKKNEILQMAILKPVLSILDETDSGLDIDALRIVADGVNKLNGDDNALILITHYQRLLDHIKPDFVHVISGGKIIKSGDKELAHELEAQGYDWLTTAN
jgi:Fe-S cluster assembly ATP-binding protein